MQISEQGNRVIVTIMPGEHYVACRDVTISTILGSCVAACLYDPKNRVIGMNHFLLSNRRYARNIPACLSEAGRYGIHAMELLINDMLKIGARKENILAKAFGGGSLYRPVDEKDNFYCVGNVNMRFIREFLQNENIPLVAEDLGGEVARIIKFQHADYAVYMKRVGSSIESSITQQEKQFWRKAVESQEREKPRIDVWD